MAEDTTPKTTQATDNSKPISAMPELTTAQGSTLVPVVDGGNKKVKLSTIKSYINEGMVAQQAGKGLSTNDFTNVLKAKLDSLSNYDDAQLRQAVNALKGEIDTILGDGATSAIDTFNEIEAFLTGITDTQTLTGLLQQLKTTITGETDGKLANKVDKVDGKTLSTNDYTNAEKAKLGKLLPNEQFGQNGIFIMSTDGTEKNDSNYCASGFMSINRQYPIIANVYSTINSSAIALFDATYKFIGALSFGVNTIGGTKDGNIYTLPAAAIPQNAVYFRVGTNKTMLLDSYYSNGPTQESREGAISDAIQASKLALFVDQWNAACGSDGKYNPANAPDAQHPFYLNTLWLTYDEALAVYGQSGRDAIPYAMSGPYIKIRTNLPLTAPSWSGYLGGEDKREFLPSALFIGNTFLEVVIISISHEIIIRDLAHMFERCSNLRKVIDRLILPKNTRTNNAFKNCAKLETITISGLSSNISFADSPLLSLASLQYLVTNAANTSEITVTVHPNVYAKLSGDTTNAAAAALTADELAAWQAVMTSAASKNIAFATTE